MSKINAQMTIREVLELNPDTADVFRSVGMHCLSCPMATAETLEEACQVHGLDAEELVAALSKVAGE